MTIYIARIYTSESAKRWGSDGVEWYDYFATEELAKEIGTVKLNDTEENEFGDIPILEIYPIQVREK